MAYCVAENCGNRDDCSQVSFHKLPIDKDLAKSGFRNWVKSIFRSMFMFAQTISKKFVLINLKKCSKSTCLRPSRQKRRLLPG